MTATVPSVPPAEGEGCRHFRRALVEAERLAAEGASPSLSDVHAHVASCDSCMRRFSSRIAAVTGLAALRARSVPPGLLDGLYERVRERAPLVPAGGGMSSAFLRAPASLAMWRRTAVAAGLLLAVGTGLVVSGRAGILPPSGERPLADARDVLLRPFDEVVAGDATGQPDGFGPVGFPGFFRRPIAPAPRPAGNSRTDATPRRFN